MATNLSEIVSNIVFENNPLKMCYSGKLLKGVVKICFPLNTCVQAIYVKFVGKGFYSWAEDISDREITGSVQYLFKRIDLVPISSLGSIAGVDVPAGSDNQYHFEIQLPSNLPTSYEGTYGHVRYTLALCCEPLGLITSRNNCGNIYDYKTTEFEQWNRGLMKIFGQLPVSGYCPGQNTNLKLDVINESGQGVSNVVVHFVKEVTYNAKNGSKKIETIILIRRKFKGFCGNETGTQSKKIELTVPSVPPTTVQSENDVCEFKYMLRVTAVTDLWLEEDPIVDIPVTIGTYPITNEMYNSVINQSTRQIFPSAPVEEVIASAPVEPMLDASAPVLERDVISVPPPCYEEAMRSTEHYEFTPTYPVCNKAMLYSK